MHEHDFAYHASLPEQLLRVSCLGKRKSLRDERLDLLLLKEVEQGDQILPKQSRLQPFERLDAVGDDPFPARDSPGGKEILVRSATPAECEAAGRNPEQSGTVKAYVLRGDKLEPVQRAGPRSAGGAQR